MRRGDSHVSITNTHLIGSIHIVRIRYTPSCTSRSDQDLAPMETGTQSTSRKRHSPSSRNFMKPPISSTGNINLE